MKTTATTTRRSSRLNATVYTPKNGLSLSEASETLPVATIESALENGEPLTAASKERKEVTYNWRGNSYKMSNVRRLKPSGLVNLHNELDAYVNVAASPLRLGDMEASSTPMKEQLKELLGTVKDLLEAAEAQETYEKLNGIESKRVDATTVESEVEAAPAPAAQKVAQKAAKGSTKKSEKTPTVKKGTHIAAGLTQPLACRVGSKQAAMLDLLSRPNGASMAELIEGLSGGAKPWQEVTVRSGFGWDMKNKGYGVESRMVDGVERFFIIVPEGCYIPAHYPTVAMMKAAKKAEAAQAEAAKSETANA